SENSIPRNLAARFVPLSGSLRSRPLQLAALAPLPARCARRPLPAFGRTPPLHCRSMGEKSGGSYSDQFPNRRLGKVPPPMPEVEPRISPPRSGGRHGRSCRRWSQGLVPHEVGEGTVAHAGGGAKD